MGDTLNGEEPETPRLRIFETAGTMDPNMADAPPQVDYLRGHHALQRLPFHVIPTVVFYLLVVVALIGTATYAIQRFWWPREELVSTHGLLANHRLNRPVTAVAVETGSQGRERLLVADKQNLFVATPVKRLKYWRWFPLDELNLARSTVRGLSASDGKIAIVPEENGRRGLVLGSLSSIDSRLSLWDRPTIDTSWFPGATDDTARAALFDRASGDRLIGGLGVAPYDPVARHWKQQLLPSTSNQSPPISDLTGLGDGMFAALGAQGVDTFHWVDESWEPVSHLDRTEAGGLGGVIPVVGQFKTTGERTAAGTGELTYLTAGQGLGRLRLASGRIDGNDVRIGEGRAANLDRDNLMRAQPGANRDSAWMLYRTGEKDGVMGVALYRFAQHQMLGLPADQPIAVGADAVMAPDPHRVETAWIGGHGLYAVQTGQDNALNAVDAHLDAGRVEEVAPGREAIFAAVESNTAPASPSAVLAASRDAVFGGGIGVWAPFIGSRRLDSPLSLSDITAATDANLPSSAHDGSVSDRPEHDSLILGTREGGIVAFERSTRELFRLFIPGGAVAPGTEDLYARGQSILQVGSDHSVNFFDGIGWKRLIGTNGTDLVADHIRTALSLGTNLVLSDGQSIARYSAQTHDWQALPPLEVSRMVVSLNSLWAIGPKDALYRLPLADPKAWESVSGDERVIDLDADPNMVAVIGQRGAIVRAWVMTAGMKEPNVVFQSNDSSGDSTEWRTFAVQGQQLFVMPHGGAIGRYDAVTHTWSSIDLPPGSAAPRDLAATGAGVWFVDSRGRASFRPTASNAWTTAAEKVQRLRSDGREIAILTDDGRVSVSADGATPLHTIVGDALSASPDRVTTGVFFKNNLIVASDAGVHRYDPQQHHWENSALAGGPVVEFAHSKDQLYARTRTGAVLLWSGNGLASWQPVLDANGGPLHADRLAGSDGSYVAAAARDGGVSALYAGEPSRAAPLLLGSRMHAMGAVSAAAEIGQELAVGTSGGTVSVFGKVGEGPRTWTNDLTKPAETGAVRALLAPPGRTDRLVVAGTASISVLSRQSAGESWRPANSVLRQMNVADAAVDANNLYGIDTRASAPYPFMRFDLSNGQEAPIVAAAFPGGKGVPSPTRAIGIAPQQPSMIWRADEAGQVAAYNMARHTWEKSGDIADVDRFFTAGGKLWSWSRARGDLAANEGGGWRREPSQWREVANDTERLVLLGAAGNVVVRDQSGDRTLVNAPDRPLPLSSAADITAASEYQGRLFIATKAGSVVAYESATHRWQRATELSDVVEFVALVDGGGLFARTSKGAVWRFDPAATGWRRVELPSSQVVALAAGAELLALTSEGELFVLDSSGQTLASYRYAPLRGLAVRSLTIVAAGEIASDLLLIARVNDGPPKALVYLPDDHRWQSLDSAAEPAYFLKAGQNTWLVERRGDEMLLQLVTAAASQSSGHDATLELEAAKGPFRDVSAGGDTIVALGGRSQGETTLVQVTATGDPVPLDIARAALPSGRRVIGVAGAGEDCVVLLDDGAIEHYTQQRQWIERLGPSLGDAGALTVDPADGEPRLIRVGHRPFRWAADRQSWVEQEPAWDEPSAPTTKLAPLPEAAQSLAPGEPSAPQTKPLVAEAHGRDCRVVASAPAPVFERSSDSGRERLTLRGSRLDIDTVEHAFLLENRLYLSTPAGPRTFSQQQGTWREEFSQPPPEKRPEPNPLAFVGERFSGAPDPAGNFRSSAGSLRLTMLLQDGNPLDLAPLAGGQDITFAHDVIRSVVQNGGAVYAATAAGVARLVRDGSTLRLAAIDGPAQGLTRTDITRVGWSAGRLVAIDRSGAEAEQVAETGRWRDVASPRAIEEPPLTLQSWRLQRNATTVRLLRALSDQSFATISLSEGGFGFDRVWAVGAAAGEVRLYTDDGLVRIAGGAAYKDLPNLDPSAARPFGPRGTAEIVEAETGGQTEVWARATGGFWRYDGQAWRSASAQDFKLAKERRQPLLWEDGTTAWSRDDAVGLSLPGGHVSLHFNAAAGRFDADQPTGIAVDEDGVATLTPAGVVRYGADFQWRGVTWPEGAAIGPATLANIGGRTLLQTGGKWFGWSGQGWSPLGDADLDGVQRARDFVLDGRFWRVSRNGSMPDIDMRLSPDSQLARVKIGADGRFDLETVRDIISTSGQLWAATQFGMVELDPVTRDIATLQATEHPAARLAAAGGEAAAQLDNGATLTYRDQQWQSGGSPEVFAAADRLVLEGGPWHWSRSSNGPKLSLDPGQGDGFWRGAAPFEVGFVGNRFAFDAVRDAAIADRPWLATAAGLIGRSGPLSAQVDPPVPGALMDGDGWSGVFAVATPANTPRLFARIEGQIAMLKDGAWSPAPADIVGDGSLLREQRSRTADYWITRLGGRVQVSVRLPDDPDGHYVAAIFDPALRRFRHDMLARIARGPTTSRRNLLVATQGGGVLALDVDGKRAVRLYAQPSSDGIGTEEIKALTYVSGAKRSLALLADGRIKRLDADAPKWIDADAKDALLLEAARHVPYDDPDGWRIELVDNGAPRMFWRHQAAILVNRLSGGGQAGGASQFAHDVAHSGFVGGDAIVVGTRGGIVRIPFDKQGHPAPAAFTLQATDVLSEDELNARTPALGIGFLRPDSSGAALYARREADGQALRVSATGVQIVAADDAGLAASEVVARDPAWSWTKSSSAAVQMTPSAVFHVPPSYNFLSGRTWSFLDLDHSNRQFPHHAMVTFRGDLFVATAGGVSRFKAPPAPIQASAGTAATAEPEGFIAEVYAQVRGESTSQQMVNVVELYVTGRQQLMARTKTNQVFVFDPDKDDWYPAPANADRASELWRVADTPLLDWRFDEAGRQSITVRPLLQDLPDQSAYPLFVNGRFAFDDVQATLDAGDALWLATGGGICIYDRSDFAPRIFVARAFLEADGAAHGDPHAAGLVRELVRDPDRPDRIVARTGEGMVLEAGATGDFRPTAAAITDGLDVFERAYTRESPGPTNHAMRFIQYPYGSSRFPHGALRARLRDGAGDWVELGRSGNEPALPLFSHERFAFDDVSDAALHRGRLLVATRVGVVTHEPDWNGQQATFFSIDVADGKTAPGQLPALHDLVGIVEMPSGKVLTWNADQVFVSDSDRIGWRKDREQSPVPVQRLQVLAEPSEDWRISLGTTGEDQANITRMSGGNSTAGLALGSASAFGDVSHAASDREWIYLPLAKSGLLQVEKAKIR